MRWKFLFMLVLLGFLGLIGSNLMSIRALAPTEKLPELVPESIEGPKRALVITAHGDDAFLTVGTTARLRNAGWEVWQLVFNHAEGYEVAANQAFDSLIVLNTGDFQARKTNDTIMYPWMPVKKELMPQLYNHAEILASISNVIQSFRPSAVFTLDNEIGGYGHPDHVYISELALELCKQSDDVKAVYQSVMPNSMESKVMERNAENMKKWNFPSAYDTAKVMYGIDGMPDPDSEVIVVDQSSAKMDFMMSCPPSDRQNLKKFMPYFEYYPAWIYFSIFDKEYYRKINLH